MLASDSKLLLGVGEFVNGCLSFYVALCFAGTSSRCTPPHAKCQQGWAPVLCSSKRERQYRLRMHNIISTSQNQPKKITCSWNIDNAY